ncbi:nuclear transport factor 2 family protein [Streptomyces sp. NPDC015131]|uniref:nuclear transport factor 2 family protein n=1 Tax=Streptomyces sp. NPDC015131 TaxID=3364941 RepID=UPI0037031B80
MTQRVDLATVMDRLAIDDVITGYAVAVDDADWAAFRALFTDDGLADYRDAGGPAGRAGEVADWLAAAVCGFPVRQSLFVNRRVSVADADGFPGDSAEVLADYVNPVRGDAGGVVASGGRCAFTLARTEDGWRVREVVVREKWRRAANGGPLSAE